MGGTLDQVLATLPLPTLVIGPDEYILAANKTALSLMGPGAVGRHFITTLRQPSLVEVVEACLQDDKSRTAQFLAGGAGTDVSYDVHVQRMEDQRGVILSFQDVTQMTQAGQMRRDFVANVSHELRTPLTALMGFIETLQGPAKDDPAARERFLGIMGSEAERMNRLVGDLLSLSRVEADERVRPRETVDVIAIVEATIRNIRALSDNADVEIDVELGPSPQMLRGDSDQLQQVFANLIENAIKYGGQGNRIAVTAKAEPHNSVLRGPAVSISVRDQGPGIAGEHLPRLTERFYRADKHRNRALGGTGLGLAIVKHILNRHRGRLKIRSTLGQGTTFIVILPLENMDHTA